MLNKSFFINRADARGGGPEIFGSRLKESLISRGYSFSPDSDNNIAIIEGEYKEGKNNILRLDGLYLDGKSVSSDKRNETILSCYREFDSIVFQSEFCKDVYEAAAGPHKNSTIINNGAPYAFSPFGHSRHIENFEKVCIASASWRRHKRLEEMVEAFSSPKLKDIGLLVLGGASYMDSAKCPENVILLPSVPPDHLPNIYRSADAMIHLAWLDWCPNTVVEGLCCGLPVLCSSNGGTKELVKNNGVVIQIEKDYIPGDPASLYSPPKVDSDIIIEGVLSVLELEKHSGRSDLSIYKASELYDSLLV